MKRTIVISMMLLLAAGVCLGQGFGNECTPAGTWYGGNPQAKYLLTIVPTRAGHFSMLAQEGYKAAAVVLTQFSGELVQEKDRNTYIGHSLALVTDNKTVPPGLPVVYAGSPFNFGAQFPDVWAIEDHTTLLDCNTLQSVVTFFGGYKWENLESANPKIPFLDPPDYIRNNVPPLTVTEIYHRMPTGCVRPDVCPVYTP